MVFNEEGSDKGIWDELGLLNNEIETSMNRGANWIRESVFVVDEHDWRNSEEDFIEWKGEFEGD